MEIECPYEDLHIYLLRGVVKREEEGMLGEAFVGNWVEDGTSFLFFSEPAEEIVASLLKSRENLELLEQYQMPYKEWQGGMLEALTMGSLSVIPPWGRYEGLEKEKTIILDPGVVFGNGLHPTTRDCMQALSFVYEQGPLARVLDLGTGTGILAMACAVLGADRVLAVDLNPLCVQTAEKNVQLNGLKEIVKVFEGDALNFLHEEVDFVIANIHYDVIHGLLEHDHFRRIPRMLISGLMRSQARMVQHDLKRYGIPIVREWEHEMTWYTILGGGGRND